ncbi:MAG: flagellar hook capping FlgD N-terminal domain-containing protein [Acidimicrobiia bacterium]
MTTSVTGVTGTTNTAATNAQSSTSSTTGLGDKNMFLKLLVAQLKYQNPLQPTDPSTFLAQSAQFSMVEKLDNLATLGQTQSSNSQLQLAASLVGKQVTYSHSGTPGTATVQSVRVDSTQGPLLRVSNALEVPLGEVTEVLAPKA